jgi:hypothetical protein
VTGENQAGASGLQVFGNVPSKADVVAHPGYQGHFAGKIQRNHAYYLNGATGLIPATSSSLSK